jgi:hypothetical protein
VRGPTRHVAITRKTACIHVAKSADAATFRHCRLSRGWTSSSTVLARPDAANHRGHRRFPRRFAASTLSGRSIHRRWPRKVIKRSVGMSFLACIRGKQALRAPPEFAPPGGASKADRRPSTDHGVGAITRPVTVVHRTQSSGRWRSDIAACVRHRSLRYDHLEHAGKCDATALSLNSPNPCIRDGPIGSASPRVRAILRRAMVCCLTAMHAKT